MFSHAVLVLYMIGTSFLVHQTTLLPDYKRACSIIQEDKRGITLLHYTILSKVQTKGTIYVCAIIGFVIYN